MEVAVAPLVLQIEESVVSIYNMYTEGRGFECPVLRILP